MKNKKEVINLFKRYGFDFRKSASSENYLAFTYKSGFFHNAELVSLYPEDQEAIDDEMESSVKELESLGFSTKKSFYNSLDTLEDELFDGFFSVSEWKNKIRKEYNDYCVKVLSALPSGANNYTYIDTPYLKNNNLAEKIIIDDIRDSLTQEGPQLLIIEAPAGFGKTSTSYEIINTLASDNTKGPIPFFTEFSRDRQARIFSHIFIREVDRSFSSVSSDVVIEKVKEGRIVIVLDGFDEILHDNSSDDEININFEEAEPMLETISELLTNNAKIILTSRRSAIFDGETFNEWMERYSDKFKINRYKLEKPEIKDWIQSERLDALSNTEIDVSRLANPVLLSYLRFATDEVFYNLCQKTELIVEHYFKSMLEREMDRQELRMSPEQQNDFLKIIASDMCDNNYTSDSKEKLVNTIKVKAGHLIAEVRKLYTAKDRPSIDKMATTLSNHAFFDRSSKGDGHIEFINEFVFGNYISEVILSSGGDWITSHERFVEPAVLSYSPRSMKERLKLWSGLSVMKEFLDHSSRMRFEGLLNDNIKESSYDGVEISSVTIRSTPFFKKGHIKNSVFNDCTFNDCYFEFSSFDDVTFINCTFWNCSQSDTCNEVNFYNCKSNNGFEPADDLDIDATDECKSNLLSDVEVYILEKMWPVGSPSIERLHHFIGTILNTDVYTKREVVKGIKSLKKSKILLDPNNANFIEINKKEIGRIKILLGRS